MNSPHHAAHDTPEIAAIAAALPAIEVRGLSRRFHIVERQPSRLIPLGMVNRLFLSLHETPFWALRNVNLTFERGKMFGFFGDNGSGKSTLLKIIAGIVTPTEGEVIVRGRVAPMLELGTGFHMDLTGMENIFLNATILGMTRAQIMERVDDIIAFAGIGEHLYSPVKFYSSGMKARLGFAVAVHLDCDIFLIDEILGVGDIHFRAKSIRKIRELRAAGKTILLVSHNVEPLKRFCDEVIWLEQGEVIQSGDPARIADAYLARCLRQTGRRPTLAQTAGAGAAAIRTERPRGSLIKAWRQAEARMGEYDLTPPHPVMAAEALDATRLVLEADLHLDNKLPGARFGVLAFQNGRSLIGEGDIESGFERGAGVPPAITREQVPATKNGVANDASGGDPLDLSATTGAIHLTITLQPAPLLNHTFEFFGVVYNAADPSVVYDVSPAPIVVAAPGKGPDFKAFLWDAPARWELNKRG